MKLDNVSDMEMMLFFSHDEGRTWSNPLPIFSGQTVSETDFVELPDGNLLFFNNSIFANPGRQFVYRPLVTEQEVRRSMVSELTTLLFDGRPEALMSHLLRSREMAPGDLDRVKRMIADAETGGGGAHNGAAVFESARPAGSGDAA